VPATSSATPPTRAPIELSLAATRDEAAELAGRTFDAAFCSNRTCEIGLEQGTGRTYESFVFALEELTRP
jgi:D-lactate dehydrogenase